MPPTSTSLKEVLELFRANHLSHLLHRSTLRAVTAIGVQLRRQQLKAAADIQAEEVSLEEDEEIPESETEVVADPFAWTPETVAPALEHMLTRATHLIRRARWYVLLSESSIAWMSSGKPDGFANLLTID